MTMTINFLEKGPVSNPVTTIVILNYDAQFSVNLTLESYSTILNCL